MKVRTVVHTPLYEVLHRTIVSVDFIYIAVIMRPCRARGRRQGRVRVGVAYR